MSLLSFAGVSAQLGARAVLREISFALEAGELVALIGPNGAGKTTLLRLAMGALAAEAGAVRLGKDDPLKLTANERAKRLAYLPQMRPLAWPLIVRDIVALGRFAYGGPLGTLNAKDKAAVDRALAASDLTAFADRRSDYLSGGELARVHLARALAAEAPLLLADEPVAALDPRHAHAAMAVLRAYCQKGGGALVTLHDISVAARYADRIILLAEGKMLADGPLDLVLTPDLLAKAYGVRAKIIAGPDGLSVDIAGPA